MNRRTSLRASLTIALAFQLPSQASACRVGWDQNLFEQSPASDVLPGAQIIRVHFSNMGSALGKWPKMAPNPDGQALGYSLIGTAQPLEDGRAQEKPFPVYAIVTSCSGFFGRMDGDKHEVVDGEYYLIGRFRSDGDGRRFLAGGVRTNGNEPIYEGWHF
jgi:hypothetical protein